MSKFNTQQIIKKVENEFYQIKKPLIKVKVGDNIRVSLKNLEGNKKRLQYYEGIVIAKKNNSINTTITVRKAFQGISIEKIFLIHSPKIESINILKSAKIRRSKLYYLRGLKGKASRLKQKIKS